MEEDIYGGVCGEDEGVYDTAGGVKKGMKYSEEGLYDNPHAGKGEFSRKQVVVNVMNAHVRTYHILLTCFMPYLCMCVRLQCVLFQEIPSSGQNGVYDNIPGQRKPGGKKGDGMEEDIYGGVGGEDEGVYDTAGGVKKGMKYSEEGLYDNPLAGKGEFIGDPVVAIVR